MRVISAVIAFRSIFYLIGMLLCILSMTMSIPLFCELLIFQSNGGRGWKGFLIGMFITGLVGSLLALAHRPEAKIELKLREAFMLTSLSWLAASLFSAIPLYWSRLSLSFLDSVFGAVSALTTTGASIFSDLNTVPQGVFLWLSILQWLGGTGIILMAMTILPILRIGGMQLFRSEFSDRSEKILPRVSQISTGILATYLFFTSVCAGCLYGAGMSGFDAICHALATVSTGGLSTHDESIAVFNSLSIEIILMIFMIIGGTSFMFFLRLWQRNFQAVWQDSQVRFYLGLIAANTILVTLWHWIQYEKPFASSLRESAFMVVSIITSTGYTTSDYTLWGPFPVVIFFMLSLIGGCTGSTSGGIKILRLQVLFQLARSHLHQLRRPHGVYIPMFQGQKITDSASMSVFTFITLYGCCLMGIACLLSMLNVDFITSFSAAAAVLGNVGCGLGPVIGPEGSYGDLTSSAKIVMMFGMFLGRLELLTILVLFMPTFWRD